jgi:diadenosine tetraphosphate (Ap4A) HIT family hydrolase
MCDLLAGRAGALHPIVRGARATAALARYALRPGHALVVAHAHVTAIPALDEADWVELALLARRTAAAIDRVLSPARCYVASLGTDAEVPMSSPHVHMHVIPVAPDEKPRDVLTWEHGVFVAGDVALADLAARLRAASI